MFTGWHDTTAKHDFKLIHIPGVHNYLQDTLSRLYEPEHEESNNYSNTNIANLTSAAVDDPIAPFNKNEILEKHHSLGHIGARKLARSVKASRISWESVTKEC